VFIACWLSATLRDASRSSSGTADEGDPQPFHLVPAAVGGGRRFKDAFAHPTLWGIGGRPPSRVDASPAIPRHQFSAWLSWLVADY